MTTTKATIPKISPKNQNTPKFVPTGSRPVRNLVSDDRTEYKRVASLDSGTLPRLHGIVCGYAKKS